jgi:predicted transcriptional regulator
LRSIVEMKLREVVKALNLKVLGGEELLGREVTGGYASDMLSDVLAHSEKGDIWVTVQIHPNVSAVATAKDLAGIIITNGRDPEVETLKKAEQKKIPILVSPLSTYKVVGRLYELGIE